MSIKCMSCMNDYGDNLNICPHCGYVRGTKATEPHHMQPETILHKKYIVGKVLGFGGFGVTYIGWDATLNKKVAIKEYLPSEFATRIPGHTEVSVYTGQQTQQLYSSGLKSFVEEAQRLAKFNCKNIVGIDDAFQENNTAYIVMEYLEGETLSSYLKRVGPLSYSDAMDVMIPLLQTLSLVHKAGIIHRDISPDNIFITSDGTVKLLDFGSARYATAYNTRSLSVIVKRGYAPPEQYQRHGQQGAWTDNYAAAATLYKMLTGVTPEDSMERVNGDRLARPSTKGVAINEGNENALMNALNLSAEKRPQTADAFLNGLLEGTTRENDIKKTDPSKFPTWLKATVAAVAAILVAVCVLFATGTLSISDGRLIFSAPVSKGCVRVPDVLKKDKDDAKATLNESDLEMLIIGRKEVEERIEKDLICEQTPGAGEELKKKGEVKVRLSDPKVGYVPNALYYTEDAAKKSFEDEGLEVTVKEEYSDTVGKGGVIKQADTKDTCKFKGDSSEIIISKGPEKALTQTGTVTIPDLKGKDFEEVRKELLKEGVFLLISEAKYDNDYAENKIISQKTSAGATVNKGENIYVTISLGKEKVRMPDVVYLDKAEAESKLENLGLKVELKAAEHDDDVDDNLILTQSVESGKLVEVESTVVIEYNSPESEPVDATAKIKVDGTVLDSKTSEPIQNASVVISEAGGNGNVVTTVMTDESGKYSTELDSGDYTISISHDKYNDTSKSIEVKQEEVKVPSIKMDEKETTTSITYGTISGTVVDSKNSAAIKNATVKIYKASSPSVEHMRVTTDASGRYSARVPDGNYIIKVSHSNYNEANRSVAVVKNTTNTVPAIKMLSNATTTTTRATTRPTTTTTTRAASATVSGKVSNALDGSAISGVSIKVRSGSNNKTGSVSYSTSTNSSGNYSLKLPNGTYTIEASKSSYITSYSNITVNSSNVSGNISLSPYIDADEVRIVLTWGESPSDLDSHLTFNYSGNSYHVYYGNPYASTSSEQLANLDIDDTNGVGPETITIMKPSDTTYTYSVYNYSGNPDITTSNARVTVYSGDRQIATYNVPTSGSGRTWNVFTIRGTSISPINTIS